MATQPNESEEGVVTYFGRTAGQLRASDGELVDIDMIHAMEPGLCPQQGDRIRFRRESDEDGGIAMDWEVISERSAQRLVA